MSARHRVGALVAIVASLAAASTLAQSQEYFRVVGVTKADMLNMRSAPNADARIVGRIPADASGIARVGKCAAWCEVRYGKITGWVSRRYLAPSHAVAPPAPIPASVDPIGDCNSDDAARRLAGCSALISRGALPPSALAVAYSRRSDAHLDSAKLDAAIADRTKASELSPDDTAYRLRLSHVYFQRAASWPLPGKSDAALKDYSDAIRADPTSHEAYAGRSSVYLLKDDYDNAITDLRAALSHYKGEKTVYESALARVTERRGIQHLLKKELDQAIARFTEAVALNASRDELYMHRASAYALKDEIEPALKDYSEAIRINPDNIEAYIGRGELYRRRTALDMALGDFDEALKREPSNVAARMFRGLSREDSRDREGAIADYQAILKHDPKHKLAKASLRRLSAHVVSPTAGPARAARRPVSSRKKPAGGARPHAKQECFAFNGQTFCN